MKGISKKTKLPTNYNKDLVNFTKEIYARIIVDICNYRKHDEDGGCNFDCIGRYDSQDFKYKENIVKLVYMPLTGRDGICEEALYSVNFPPSVKFSESTKKMIRIEFEKVRELLVKNFNEIRELTGGKWFEQLKEPIHPRRILGLQYDLYFVKEKQGNLKMKFNPGNTCYAPDGGRWIPYDVKNIYSSMEETREEMNNMYAEIFKDYGYSVVMANNG